MRAKTFRRILAYFVSGTPVVAAFKGAYHGFPNAVHDGEGNYFHPKIGGL
jgi:hypothetical protein